MLLHVFSECWDYEFTTFLFPRFVCMSDFSNIGTYNFYVTDKK